MLQAPALILSLVLATAYAAAFHLWQGRSLRDLVFYWLAAVVGFASGQVAGYLLGLIPWTIGQVRIVEASLVAFLFLFIARWLRQEKRTP
jgi:thiamine transporter ThiT